MEENETIITSTSSKKFNATKKTVFTALYAAIICATTFFNIPLPGLVPIVIQDMIAKIGGMILGPLCGTASVIIFFILGCIGLPVFSGKAGINVLLHGPTSGFLFAYLICSFVGGILTNIFLNKNKEHSQLKQWIVISAILIFITLILFFCGIVGFIIVTKKSLQVAVAATITPFILGTIIKICIAIPLVKFLRPIALNYLDK